MIAVKTSVFTVIDANQDGILEPDEIQRYSFYTKNLDADVLRLFTITQGNISFGKTSNGKNGQNIFGQWATVADTGTANTEFSVTHALAFETRAVIPANFLVTYINVGGVVYDSGTPWTSSHIYLKCSVAHAKLNLFITR